MCFEQRSLTLENAFKSDISPIFGDCTFIIDEPIYRKTLYGIENGEGLEHEKYGSIKCNSISTNGENYIEISSLESAVIDSFINMGVESQNKNDTETEVIEKSKGIYMIKLSNLVIRHLGVFGVDLSFEYADFSRRLIIELMKKIGITMSFGIPETAGNISSQLYKTAFSDTHVWSNYKSVHNIEDTLKVRQCSQSAD